MRSNTSQNMLETIDFNILDTWTKVTLFSNITTGGCMEQSYIDYVTVQGEHGTFDESHEQGFSKHYPYFTHQSLRL